MGEQERYPIGVMPLDRFCTRYPRVALAFSGGCDSSYLLTALIDAGVDVKAYTVNTVFQPAFELRDALRMIEQTGASFEIIDLDVLSQAGVCANPEDRCYLCKQVIFGAIIERMERDGYTVLVDGTNATDDPERRPGFRALHELGVLSPLRLAGLSKGDIRAASAQRGLFTAEKPNFSCLATKIPTGTTITREGIEAVARVYENDPWNGSDVD